MAAPTDKCQCGREKDRRASLCRACRPGRPAGKPGRNVQFWLSGEALERLERLGGDAWAKAAVLAALDQAAARA